MRPCRGDHMMWSHVRHIRGQHPRKSCCSPPKDRIVTHSHMIPRMTKLWRYTFSKLATPALLQVLPPAPAGILTTIGLSLRAQPWPQTLNDEAAYPCCPSTSSFRHRSVNFRPKSTRHDVDDEIGRKTLLGTTHTAEGR